MTDYHRIPGAKECQEPFLENQTEYPTVAVSFGATLKWATTEKRLQRSRIFKPSWFYFVTQDPFWVWCQYHVFFACALWMLVAMVVAVRQALDYHGTGRAIAVCLIGWLVHGVILGLVLTLLGI